MPSKFDFGRTLLAGLAMIPVLVSGALAEASLDAVIKDLVAANRILYRQGVVDGFGHVSVRHPANKDRYLMSASLAPGRVTKDDIMEFDLDVAADRPARPLDLLRALHPFRNLQGAGGRACGPAQPLADASFRSAPRTCRCARSSTPPDSCRPTFRCSRCAGSPDRAACWSPMRSSARRSPTRSATARSR